MDELAAVLDGAHFDEIDQNSDGKLSLNELDEWTNKKAKQYFEKADTDGSSGVSQEELAGVFDEVLALDFGGEHKEL